MSSLTGALETLYRLNFVDAAHLTPFAESQNDHPTNGISLCKNHHWAMDQHLIAPGPQQIWQVSNRLDPRRSRGEEDLLRLKGQTLLLPKEPAYSPAPDALAWRMQHLAG